jgi:hypothetical protein
MEVSMVKKLLVSGILGGVVMFVVTVACRFLLPGVGNPKLRAMPDQVQIHAALKVRITKPGTYVCPYLPPGETRALFPDYLNEPVFAVTYNGYTHATVPGFKSAVGILSFLFAPLAAAWLLSQTSDRLLATYFRRVIYVAALGVFVAVSADFPRTLTEERSFTAVAGMAGVSVITWVSVGLVLAWRIRPDTAKP